MTHLERRYRRFLRAYPRSYRSVHGDELLDVLLEMAGPERRVPEVREAAGLVLGGLRERLADAAQGSAWAGGLHLGVTALSVAHLAALLPYAGSIPLWTALSALALLAVLRGRMWPALPLVLLTGAKAVTIAYGGQLFEQTLLPVDPGLLTDDALFGMTGPAPVATGYALALFGLLALAVRGGPPRIRSWWWTAAILPAAWAGPAWMASGTSYVISLSRVALELALFGLAVYAGRLTCDLRWALGAWLYLLAVSATFAQNAEGLTRQHVAYWGLLALLTVTAALVPYGFRRRALN